jgi:hypothetical protein
MGFNDSVTRTNATPLIPEDVSNDILNLVAVGNPLMTLARRLPNMARAQQRMPVMSALATAYFVAGDTGLKQTSNVSWDNKYIDAEELAVIVPIPQAVLDDVNYDLWGQIKPELVAAFDKAIAAAVLYGVNIPATWTTNLGAAGIVAGAVAKGHSVSLAAFTDPYEATLGMDAGGNKGVYMLVEEDGFGVSGNLSHISMKGILRNTRDANGNPIFKTSPQDSTRYELDGAPLYFPLDGSIDPAQALMISGEWNQLVYSMRQDITYKILDQAVIQDNAGAIVYNLAQQDMVALRAVMRIGFALPNPLNRMNSNAATRYPFSVLKV